MLLLLLFYSNELCDHFVSKLNIYFVPFHVLTDAYCICKYLVKNISRIL